MTDPVVPQEVKLHHHCEVCGTHAILTPSEAFEAGWDYPPRMGTFGILSPRTCGNCGIEGTIWFQLITAQKNNTPFELTMHQEITLARIQGEPASILVED